MSLKLSAFSQFILMLIVMIVILLLVNQQQKQTSAQSYDSMVLTVVSPTNELLKYQARQVNLRQIKPEEQAVQLFKISTTVTTQTY